MVAVVVVDVDVDVVARLAARCCSLKQQLSRRLLALSSAHLDIEAAESAQMGKSGISNTLSIHPRPGSIYKHSLARLERNTKPRAITEH